MDLEASGETLLPSSQSLVDGNYWDRRALPDGHLHPRKVTSIPHPLTLAQAAVGDIVEAIVRVVCAKGKLQPRRQVAGILILPNKSMSLIKN